MNSSLRTLSFLLFLLPLSVGVYGQSSLDTDKIDQYFSLLEKNNRFMGSVFIMKDDETLYEHAYGKISEDGKRAQPSSKYRIGSITKSYTAVLILQLVEEGQLSLDTTLNHFFPGIPGSESITIEQMLRHQSGLVNFTNLEEYTGYMSEPRSREQHLENFEQIGTSFEAGSDVEYSNTAYVLLGFIIEDLTGMSYADALQERISQPLGLMLTYVGDGIDTDAGEAASFFYRGGWQLSPETDMSVPHAAGSIVSTARETALFYHALFNGELLNEESFEAMVSFEGPFGMGLIRFPFHDKTLIGHNGGIDGYQSNSAYQPEDEYIYAVLGNAVNLNFNNILIALNSIIYNVEFEMPTFETSEPITLGEEQLELYAGTYSSPGFPLQIRLFAEDGNMFGQATGQGPFPLTIYDERTMRFDQAGIEIVFEEMSEEEERYKEFRFTQGGSSFQFSLEPEGE
ncbi:class A beta-lactamase-related serine hydrolase [Rhodohalobacter sp. SW132]|uniref:serine hydrolase domain-containing protein n=1 Tax=Rhodohalobacter sp. SW132 TaxID=2293433 RepID=UPI000E240829|nr:serine hydrolase domain-containing protein [Rhodohalobacter sp. SW132]REL24458.1 class A beta-lactamase-related serine hydrolase [Rhodohalobacter sp. SW132]